MANPIKNLIGAVSGNIAELRSNTYLTNTDNKRQLNKLRNDIYKSIDNINNRSYENTGLNSVSTLYSRIINTMKDPSLPDNFNEIFNNDALMSSLSINYMNTRSVYDYDKEIDLVCSYMPKLQEALDTKRDHVLSPDHFSKEFLKIKRDTYFSFDDTHENIFNRDIKILKNKYRLEELIEESYDKTSKYGEDFIYHVPYSTAIDKLLTNKEKYNSNTNNILGKMVISTNESGNLLIDSKPISDTKYNTKDMPELKIEFSNQPYIESLISDSYFVSSNIGDFNTKSLVYENRTELQNSIKDATNGKIGDRYIGTKQSLKLRPFDTTIGDSIRTDSTIRDGFIDINKKDNTKPLNVKGCILKSVEGRHRIIPIYIDNINMGFYYFEIEETDEFSSMTNVSNMFANKTGGIRIDQEKEKVQDEMLKAVASAISNKLDRTFINNNQDLTKEIYSILKYNDLYNTDKGSNKMKVTYIPPEDMTHCYFKKDPITNRGISDLAKALIPAKLWVCLNLTYIIGNMTRGQDKRVYYVKQTVDTNISQTLLTTIDQIKRSNFNIRQIENINNILNIIGKFNDYVIPVNQSGDAPINFEVMPGQDIQPPTEIMEKLEESAINSTDVPLEVVNSRMSMDFATHYTMSNTRFLRKVIKRQAICEEDRMYSGIITRVYNIEYGEHEVLKLNLPMPLFLDISNTSQILQNSNDLSNTISEIFLTDEEDENVRNIFTKKVKMDYLSTYVNIDKLNDLLIDSKIEARKKELGNTEQ